MVVTIPNGRYHLKRSLPSQTVVTISNGRYRTKLRSQTVVTIPNGRYHPKRSLPSQMVVSIPNGRYRPKRLLPSQMVSTIRNSRYHRSHLKRSLPSQTVVTIRNGRYHSMPHRISGNRGAVTDGRLPAVLVCSHSETFSNYLFMTLFDLWYGIDGGQFFRKAIN